LVESPRTEDVDEDLQQLFDLAVRGEDALARAVATGRARTEPYMYAAITPSEGIFLDATSLRHLNRLRTRYAKASLLHGGHSPDQVERIAIEAVKIALTETPKAGRQYFEEALNGPSEVYTIAEPIIIHTKSSYLKVGKCELFRDVKRLVDVPDEEFFRIGDRNPTWVITTDVKAKDKASAAILAHDSIAETKAILTLLDRSDGFTPEQGPSLGIDREARRVTSIRSGTSPYFQVDRADSEGNLHPGYADLSAAARLEPQGRTEWQERALAATRWYYEAVRNPWPTGQLAAELSALECLCLKGEKRGKGRHIANRIVGLRTGFSSTEDRQFRKWLERLYERRNGAVHRGEPHLDELATAELRIWTLLVLVWAIGHLDSRSDQHFRTIDDAFPTNSGANDQRFRSSAGSKYGRRSAEDGR
jgi:hypothetical protein